jgi:hypothetical protein
MSYQLNVKLFEPLTEEEKSKIVKSRGSFDYPGQQYQDTEFKMREVLTVELTEEQWKAVKKAVIEAC